MGGSITDPGMISRGFTPTELHAVIRQAETLLGASLDDLVQS